MKRREFIRYLTLAPLCTAPSTGISAMPVTATRTPDTLTLFLAGDVMTGRAIDQVLPFPGNPRIHEPYSDSALDYLRLTERASGPLPRPVDFAWIWGDALALLDQAAPDLRIINLETAVTARGDPWPRKGIQYRMHPANLPCLTVAGIDCCVLANNHVLDWGYAGLEETLASLNRTRLATAGAGPNLAAALRPAALPLPGRGRVLVFAWGVASSGIPPAWAAGQDKPGISRLPDLSGDALDTVLAAVAAQRRDGDLVMISLHWGGNWGYPVPEAHRRFAHALIDSGTVDLIHGHSSHHPLGIEVYRDRLILYGCGDLINDYEGISGHEEYRGDLGLLYLVTLARDGGALRRLELIPLQRRLLRLIRVTPADRAWLQAVLDRESRALGTARVEAADDSVLRLRW